MVIGKVPASTILVGAQFMAGIEMPPEYLAAPAAALSTSFRFHESKNTSPGSPQKIDRVVLEPPEYDKFSDHHSGRNPTHGSRRQQRSPWSDFAIRNTGRTLEI